MRITIEPTKQGIGRKFPNPKVTLELPDDHMGLGQVIEELVVPALKAFGYLISED
jgi:hypothetical protein